MNRTIIGCKPSRTGNKSIYKLTNFAKYKFDTFISIAYDDDFLFIWTKVHAKTMPGLQLIYLRSLHFVTREIIVLRMNILLSKRSIIKNKNVYRHNVFLNFYFTYFRSNVRRPSTLTG